MVSTLHSSLSIIYSFNLCSDSRYSSQKHYLMAFGLVWFINNFKDKQIIFHDISNELMVDSIGKQFPKREIRCSKYM